MSASKDMRTYSYVEDSKKGRGRPPSIDKDIVQALDVLRGLDLFKTGNDEKLKALEVICSKKGGLDAILNKKYKLKVEGSSIDEKQVFEDLKRVREYYDKHPAELDKHLAKFDFSDREDFEQKHRIVHSCPHVSPFLTDVPLEDLDLDHALDHALDQAIDAATENQHDVRVFSEFEYGVLNHCQIPASDLSEITSFHFKNQQNGGGKTFAQRLRKKSIRLEEVEDEVGGETDTATGSW